jgi:glycerate dehydrogenase
MNIVVLDGFTLNPGDLDWSGFEALGSFTVYDRSIGGEAQVVERARDAEIVLTNKTALPASTLDRLPKLKYIGVLATGFNVVDTDAAAERGIPVTNIPTYGTDSVAQMVFAHLLHHCHHVFEHSGAVKAGEWSKQDDFCFWSFPLTELAGLTMGIIGFGRIGRRVGELAHAFGMRVVAHDLYASNPPDWEGFRFLDTDALLREADVVSLNCPLTADNEGMINARALATMKSTSILINCSRGPLVVATDLADALNAGTIAAAGLDVLPDEPPEDDSPLFTAKNCTITPHIAWATRSARSRLMNTAVENVRAFLDGKLQNVVNGVNAAT